MAKVSTVEEYELVEGENKQWVENEDKSVLKKINRITTSDQVQLMRDMQRIVDSQFTITAVVQTHGIHVFVPKKTSQWGHSTGNNIGEALGVCTKKTEYIFEFTTHQRVHTKPKR